MTAAKVMDLISGLPDCDQPTLRHIGGRFQTARNSKVRMSRFVDTSSTKTIRGSSAGAWMGKSTELEMSICSSETKMILIGTRG